MRRWVTVLTLATLAAVSILASSLMADSVGAENSASERLSEVVGGAPWRDTQARLITACMAEAGLEFQVPPPTRPLVENELSFASTYGYGISTSDVLTDDLLPQAAVAPIPPDETETFVANLQSCTAKANTEIGLEPSDFNDLVSVASVFQMEVAERMATELDWKSWAECMQAGEDVDVTTRADLVDKLRGEWSAVGESASARQEFVERERSVAVADYNCSEGIRVTIERIEDEVATAVWSDHADVLNRLASLG